MTSARIVKVGGSLVDWPPLARVLPLWLAAQPPALNVLLCGGGNLVEAIRAVDQHFSLDDETAHWLCIDALSISARLLAGILRDLPVISQFEHLRAEIGGGEASNLILDPREFLHDWEPRQAGLPLPRDWSVTSDSIAVRLAEVLSISDLVLLKSADPPAASREELSAAGYVDSHLAKFASSGMQPRFVNLRRFDVPGNLPAENTVAAAPS
jgi:5-(aminomethyl)-3-furanmethanol phosphate kinase